MLACKSLETKIVGEALFNDRAAIVVFIAIAGMAVDGQSFSMQRIGLLFVQQAIGGALFGCACGWVVLRMLKRVDNYKVETLLLQGLTIG